jgi:hypothetical protein
MYLSVESSIKKKSEQVSPLLTAIRKELTEELPVTPGWYKRTAFFREVLKKKVISSLFPRLGKERDPACDMNETVRSSNPLPEHSSGPSVTWPDPPMGRLIKVMLVIPTKSLPSMKPSSTYYESKTYIMRWI